MRLSAEAKALLDANQIEELKALPIERLIDATDLIDYQRCCANPLGTISSLDSVVTGLHDPISMESLLNPVVISSGFIFSETTAQNLLKNAAPTCPITHESLLKNVYGPEGSRQSYVHLPKIEKAVDAFRYIRDIAREEARSRMGAAAGGAGAAGTGPAIVTAAIAAPDSSVEPQVLLYLKVSDCKMRVFLENKIDFRPMTPFFKEHFPKRESEIKPNTAGYQLDTGCCWGIQPAASARLEFWFEAHSQPTNDEVIALMQALLGPLGLPTAEIPEDVDFGTIESLEPRVYRDAFHPLSISLEQAMKCCKAFLSAVRSLASDKRITLNDVVVYTKPQLVPAEHKGVMFFGPKPPAAATITSYEKLAALAASY